MKPLRKKMSRTEWSRNLNKRYNYKKFVKTTLIERRKQYNLHHGKTK